MSELYNYEYYHSGCGPIPYEEPEKWIEFFGSVADRIVKDLNPKTVLDAGCAMGYLVAALRDRGVEAYGLDISDYAISMVREDVRPYCAVGSLVNPLPDSFPKQFDLVTNIEVTEHLYAEDGKTTIENLCSITDCIIFSSTPDDFSEPTHFNVQQREYWARLFASAGFYDDLNYRPVYLTAHAVCYRRKTDLLRQIEDYERSIRLLEARHSAAAKEWSKRIQDQDSLIARLNQELALQKNLYQEVVNQRDNVSQQLNVISNAGFWKITKPLRVVLDGIKRFFHSNRDT